MFKSLFANDSLRVVAKAKKTETRGRKTLSKRQKVLNLLSKGGSVTWKTLRNRFDLVSPRALVDTLRAEGNMIYVNKTAKRAGRKTLSKRQKVLNLLSKGESVTWKTLRNRFDLVSPRALVDTLRAEGNMIYVNQTAKGTSYRMGTPTKAIIAAGIKKLYGTPFAYKNA